jgi:hypothetical protein
MEPETSHLANVSSSIIDAIRSFPRERVLEHCGSRVVVSPFDIYASCPRCGGQVKLRSFSAVPEVEDVFDAVFEWMLQPGAMALVRRRQHAIESDRDE